jgi:hypothetical protein
MTKRKANGLDPTTLDLARPPGLVGLLVDHGERCTPYVTRWPALIGALVGFSAATGNRFALRVGQQNHVALNLYGAAIGTTGSGKETALRLATATAECGNVAQSNFASPEGLHRALAAERKDFSNPKVRLLTQDEWGRALQQIKADHGGGHQRGVMTKAMECYGAAIGGALKERHYSKAKDLLPAVSNPFLCCLFATTSSTLLEALTSAEVRDGTLNRILLLYLDAAPELRPLDDKRDMAIPDELAALIRRAAGLELEEEEKTPSAYITPTRTPEFRNQTSTLIGSQQFLVIKAEPGALAALATFRNEAHAVIHADEELGSLWSRAFENAARVAAALAVGEACPDYGPLVLSERTAAWAVAFTRHCIETTVAQLRDNLADTEAEHTRLRIMRHAWHLSAEALTNPNPTTEHTAPQAAQDEIHNLKRAGYFAKSALIQRVHHKGCASDKIGIELRGLVEAERMQHHVVEWKPTGGQRQRQRREFFRPIEPE